MTHAEPQRRLAAILSADVMGYGRLMGVDEEGSRRRFNALFAQTLTPEVEIHHGRVVKTMGDGVPVEFSRADHRCSSAP